MGLRYGGLESRIGPRAERTRRPAPRPTRRPRLAAAGDPRKPRVGARCVARPSRRAWRRGPFCLRRPRCLDTRPRSPFADRRAGHDRLVARAGDREASPRLEVCGGDFLDRCAADRKRTRKPANRRAALEPACALAGLFGMAIDVRRARRGRPRDGVWRGASGVARRLAAIAPGEPRRSRPGPTASTCLVSPARGTSGRSDVVSRGHARASQAPRGLASAKRTRRPDHGPGRSGRCTNDGHGKRGFDDQNLASTRSRSSLAPRLARVSERRDRDRDEQRRPVPGRRRRPGRRPGLGPHGSRPAADRAEWTQAAQRPRRVARVPRRRAGDGRRGVPRALPVRLARSRRPMRGLGAQRSNAPSYTCHQHANGRASPGCDREGRGDGGIRRRERRSAPRFRSRGATVRRPGSPSRRAADRARPRCRRNSGRRG